MKTGARVMLAGWLLCSAAACSRSSGPGLDGAEPEGVRPEGAGSAGTDAPVAEDHSLPADELPALPARWVAVEDDKGLSLLRFGDVAPAETVLGPRTEDIRQVQSWSYEPTWSTDGQSVAFLTHVVDSGEPLLQVARRARDWQPQAVELPRSGRIVPRWAGQDTLVVTIQPRGEKSFQHWLVRVGDSVRSELLGGGLPWAVWESSQGPTLLLGKESLLVTEGAPPQPLSTEALFVGCLPSSSAGACLADICDRLHWSPDGRFIAGCERSTAISPPAAEPSPADPQGPLAAGDVRIGVIPLPPGPRELIDRDPHGDLGYYSTPTGLQWAKTGSLAAYVMYNFPVSAKSDFECAPRRLELVDVATAELLNEVELDCGTPDQNEHSFSFADDRDVLVARVSVPKAGVELVRASSDREPEVLADFAGESAVSINVSADGDGVYLITYREEAELSVVRYARLAELDRSSFLELSLPGYPLRYSIETQGAGLMFEIEAPAPCMDSCRAMHVLEPGDGEIRDAVLDGSDRDEHFVPDTGIIGPRPGGGLVLRLERAYDVAYAVRDEAASWVSVPPRFGK